MRFAASVFLGSLSILPALATIDVRQEMARAERTGKDARSRFHQSAVVPFWPASDSRLFCRIDDGSGGHSLFSIDLTNGAKSPAFDHSAFATALAKATGNEILPNKLPVDFLETSQNPGTLILQALGKSWRFDTTKHLLTQSESSTRECPLMPPDIAMRGSRKNGPLTELSISNKTGGKIEMYWVDGRGKRKSYGTLAPGKQIAMSSFSGHVWLFTDSKGTPLAGATAMNFPSVATVAGKLPSSPRAESATSPDGRWRAIIRNHNLSIIPSTAGEAIDLTNDGTPQEHYNGPFFWSPDSKTLAAWKTHEVEVRKVHIVQSSPPDQLQPKLLSIDYPKPGDPIRQKKPLLFDVEKRSVIPVSDALFNNPWEINRAAWSPDSKEFSFLYNQRGHQVMRVVGINIASGSARAIIGEQSKTFIDYSQKTWLHRLRDTQEILWASERDGTNRIYLIDTVSGKVRNPVTPEKLVIREVVEVDEKNRTLLIKIMGVEGQDPYHEHFARVGFDGSGFTRLTDGDGTHQIEISPDGRLLLDRWSRVDHPPVVELRDAVTGKRVAELAHDNDKDLLKAGWLRPERFISKGRDGTTDIYGVIYRPTNFDPTKRYPVIEDIYAGPHDHFVPKDFSVWTRRNQMAELGFVVVGIDGMGTNWRSRAFHDVCWKNLADSGFPDRIPWIKAAASTRPWMDLGRVGIYGGSAGGQSTLAGLLHHGDFYKAGVADCGCHDNRMDKTWWNEAWMGWPVDENYQKNSNVTHAAKLTGKLMLIVGELDHNVDPASTAQVVAALQKAGKDFDFVPVINSDHGAAETPYGSYRRALFLMRHFLDPQAK